MPRGVTLRCLRVKGRELPGECLPQGRLRQPCLGLKSDVGAELENASAAIVIRGNVGKAQGASGADATAIDKTAWSTPIRMVEDVQGLGLEGKPKSFR